MMTEMNDRRLPVGIPSFEEIRKERYLYVDKTEIIWYLVNRGKSINSKTVHAASANQFLLIRPKPISWERKNSSRD